MRPRNIASFHADVGGRLDEDPEGRTLRTRRMLDAPVNWELCLFFVQ